MCVSTQSSFFSSAAAAAALHHSDQTNPPLLPPMVAVPFLLLLEAHQCIGGRIQRSICLRCCCNVAGRKAKGSWVDGLMILNPSLQGVTMIPPQQRSRQQSPSDPIHTILSDNHLSLLLQCFQKLRDRKLKLLLQDLSNITNGRNGGRGEGWMMIYLLD